MLVDPSTFANADLHLATYFPGGSLLRTPVNTYHHHGILVNGRDLICNDSQIENCVKECARQFPLIDQQACVTAVEAKWAPYSHCFSGEMTVIVKGYKNLVKLSDVQIGDYVLGSDFKYTRITGWLHREEQVEAHFIDIHHANGVLSVSSDHLLYCTIACDYVRASEVQEVETMHIDGSLVPSKIIRREPRTITGIYAPLTASGTLMVSGVHASCYSSPSALPFRVSQSMGQVALLPFRWGPASSLLDTYCRSLYHLLAAA